MSGLLYALHCIKMGETASSASQNVVTGLDPVIHLLRKILLKTDGLPGQARQ
jgi:hypothetical protein